MTGLLSGWVALGYSLMAVAPVPEVRFVVQPGSYVDLAFAGDPTPPTNYVYFDGERIELVMEFINPSSQEVRIETNGVIDRAFEARLVPTDKMVPLTMPRGAYIRDASREYAIDWSEVISLPAASALRIVAELAPVAQEGSYTVRVIPRSRCGAQCELVLHNPLFRFEIRASTGTMERLDALVRVARRELNAERPASADAALDKLLSLYPNSAVAYRLKGVVAERAGRSDEAVRAYETAAQLLATGRDEVAIKRNGPRLAGEMLANLRRNSERVRRER